MRRLWAGETVSHQGRWTIANAHIAPTPPEPIEVWIAAEAEPAIERAARLGDGWIAAPSLTPARAKVDLARYLVFCEQYQRAPGARVIRRDIYVGTSADEAAATGRAVADAFFALGQMGFTHILVRNLVSTQAHALASIERLARVKELVNSR